MVSSEPKPQRSAIRFTGRRDSDNSCRAASIRSRSTARAAVWPVVTALQGTDHVAAVFGVTVGAEPLDGVDYWRLGADGRIVEMTVLWRPLPAMIAVAAKL